MRYNIKYIVLELLQDIEGQNEICVAFLCKYEENAGTRWLVKDSWSRCPGRDEDLQTLVAEPLPETV